MKTYKIETDDRNDFYHYFMGRKYYSFLCELYNDFRDKVKYTDETGSWEAAYKLLIESLNEENIDLFND